MSIWKRKPPDRALEKTIGVTQSQILSTSPTRPEPPREPPTPPPRRAPPSPQEMSMWGGNVLMSDEFAPDAGRKRPRSRSRVLGMLVVVGGLTAGGIVWGSWPRVPFSKIEWPGLSTSSSTVAGKPAPVPVASAPTAPATPAKDSADSVVKDSPASAPPPAATASPTTAPDVAPKSSAAVTESPSGSGRDAAPTEPAHVVKRAHSTHSLAKSKSSRRHHVKVSKPSKHLHAKTTHRIAASVAE